MLFGTVYEEWKSKFFVTLTKDDESSLSRKLRLHRKRRPQISAMGAVWVIQKSV